jgi:4-amino-4-deoxy-L-arabinose transferase-like glycosyltransferase
MKYTRSLLLVAAVAFILFVPWLGNTYFYTKGEPREAIVAMSMLQSGDWVLPMSYGEDMPYKPPMLAWLIAIFSTIFGGHVSEFTSRLPSAVAAVAILVGGWSLVRRKMGSIGAWVMMLVTASSFEFFRAATACRVDMVLTACMLGAIYIMYDMRGRLTRALLAVLLLSGATLTKGPIGSLLPCLAMGIYFLLRGDNFWRTLGKLTALCLASFVLPAMWYYAAYQRGGDTFLALAFEENIGRLTGTMTYESHLNPWYYNIWCILAGMLPWTVPTVIALCYRRIRTAIRTTKLDKGLPLLCIVAGLTIFVFYCIPASKRGVYLLPCYPFLAYGATWVLLQVSETRMMHVYTIVLSVLAVIAPVVFMAASFGLVGGLHIAHINWPLLVVAALPSVVGAWCLLSRSGHGVALTSALWVTYIILIAYNAAYMPMVLNARSDHAAAQAIEARVPDKAPIVSLISYDDMLRYYSINYYLGDRLRRVESADSVPAGAWLITEPSEALSGDTITVRSCDTHRPVILVAPRR